MGRLYNPPLSQLMFETNLIGASVVKIILKLSTFVDRNLSATHVTPFPCDWHVDRPALVHYVKQIVALFIQESTELISRFELKTSVLIPILSYRRYLR